MPVYKSVVLYGDKIGRTIGFPTINLDATVFPGNMEQGVYASQVQVGEKNYMGALFYGPRLVLKQTKLVLEIHLLDFNQEIYGKEVTFEVGKYIREVRQFNTLLELKNTLETDMVLVKKAALFT